MMSLPLAVQTTHLVCPVPAQALPPPSSSIPPPSPPGCCRQCGWGWALMNAALAEAVSSSETLEGFYPLI